MSLLHAIPVVFWQNMPGAFSLYPFKFIYSKTKFKSPTEEFEFIAPFESPRPLHFSILTQRCSDWFHGVLPNTDSAVFFLPQTLQCPAHHRLTGVLSITDSTVSCLLQTQRCPVYHRLYGVLPSTNSAVSSLSQTLRCPAFYKLSGVLSITDSVVSCLLQTLRCPVYHRLSGVLLTTAKSEFVASSSCTLVPLPRRCPAHHGVWRRGVLHTAEFQKINKLYLAKSKRRFKQMLTCLSR